MVKRNLSKADLARKLGKSRSWITQLLSGGSNMTIAILAEAAHSMDAEIRLKVKPSSKKRESR